MTEHDFVLHLSAEEYLRFYEGVAKAIQVESTSGKTIRFPANKMRQFVLADGIHGTFRMQLENNKIISIIRLR
ncbi:MAG TPA: DUF2835 family protein [Gammaproteobacteria bacterium]|nr:DUF2835 family protein [Gammaproteobacteria bacterium]